MFGVGNQCERGSSGPWCQGIGVGGMRILAIGASRNTKCDRFADLGRKPKRVQLGWQPFGAMFDT